MEEFVNLGKWWLPNNPEREVAGKLSFSPSSGATLELIGSFYDTLPLEEIGKAKDFLPADESFLPKNVKITEETRVQRLAKLKQPIIHGLLENNEKVTLYNCFGSVVNFDLTENRSNLFFKATYIFRKIHFSTEEEIKFNSISVRYSHLEEWIGKSGFQIMGSPEGNRLSIDYQLPSCIPIAQFEDLDISITFPQMYINLFERSSGETYYKINIEQKTFLTLDNPKYTSIDKCIEIIADFRDFLTFAMSRPSSVYAVTGKVNVTYDKPFLKDDGSFSVEKKMREDQVDILFGLWNAEKSSDIKISLHEMLFSYSDIESQLGNFFKQWLCKKEVYEPVFEFLMTTIYTPNLYLHYNFLNMIQALEVYHSYKDEGKYQNPDIYDQGILKDLLEIIENFPSESHETPNGISDDFRNALNGKVKYLNENSLQTRLKKILKDITSLLPDDFIGKSSDRKEFIYRASNTRHALTHHNKNQKEETAKGQELLQIFHTLKVILQCCLLKELGFTDELIKELIERNRDYQREWRLPK